MNAKANSNLLRNVPLFKDLSLQELKKLEKTLKDRSYKKGDILFLEDRACDSIFIVQTGRVKIFRTAVSGREQILEVLGPGETCACNPGASKWHCATTAQALSDCEIWLFPRDYYVKLVHSNSSLMLALNQLFATRICKLSALIEEVSLDNPQRRLIKFILDILKTQEDQGIPFTHEEISQRLGLVRETVTRHLNQLKKSNLIEIKARKIYVLDKAGLEKMLLI